MPPSQAVQQRIHDWITQNAPLLKCVGCGGRNWDFGDPVLCIRAPNFPSPVTLGGPGPTETTAFVPVTCAACGYSVFFLASALGLMPLGR